MRVAHVTYGRKGQPHRGVERVIGKIREYAPQAIEEVINPAEAEMLILHVTGRHDHVAAHAREALARGGGYVVCQYSLASTRNPDPRDWAIIWNSAKLLFSYYDVRVYAPGMYLAPLGSDPAIFYRQPEIGKEYLLGTLGISYKAECVGECQLALHRCGGRGVHIGPNFNSNPIVDYLHDITDAEVRATYNRCKWFGVLRRGDGFEMPGAEALLCGCRPIMFDKPNFRLWYDGLADFVPEQDPAPVVRELERLLRNEHPVTEAESAEAKNRFDWEKIMRGFWERIV